MVFVDGQNLFHAARRAFGYETPNCDVEKLATALCIGKGWDVSWMQGLRYRIRFYTGIPTPEDDPHWHQVWADKLQIMGRQQIKIYTRPLRYRTRKVRLKDGTQVAVRVGEEKGVDVQLALDVLRLANDNAYDVALIVSQDQDFIDIATEVRRIAKDQNRWIKIASAFPVGPGTKNRRGINGTDWIPITKEFYDRCLEGASDEEAS